MKHHDKTWCEICEMWLNGETQVDDHRIGKKHRRNTNKSGVEWTNSGKQKVEHWGINRRKGVVVPRGTCLVLEQVALLKDATDKYMLSLYAKSAFRAKL